MADNIPNFKCAIPSTALNNALFGGQSAYTLLGPDGIPQTALANLGAGVRPNLLDNPYFAGNGQLPVNQRGAASWTGASSYVELFDCWLGFYSGGGVTFTLSNAGLFLPAAPDYATALQRLTRSNTEMAGKTYTVSVVVDGEVITGTGVVTEQELSGTATFFSGTGTNGVMVRLRCSSVNGMFFEVYAPRGGVTITACKLEEGEGQTLACRDADGNWQLLPQPDMDYGTQLEKCQRFLHKIPIGSYHGRASSSSAVRFTIPIYPPMRANPVLQGNASWMCNRYDGHQIAISSIAPSSVYDSEAGFVSLLAVVDGADSLADYTLTLLSASEPVYLSAQL